MNKRSKTARGPEGKASKPIRPEPTPQKIARMAEAKRRNAERLERPSIGLTRDEPKGGKIVVEIDVSRAGRETILDAFGTTSMDFVQAELEHLSNYQRGREPSGQEQRNLNAAIAVIDGTRPENEAAAMLASQMAVTHSLAMDMLGRAKRAELIPQADSAGSLAVKLLRTYTAQVEALAKLKRGGEQTVRVEHVHVYPGGQAIVGAVSNRKGEGGGVDERARQADGASDLRAITFAPSAALLSPDASWNALPEGSGDGEETLSDARRSPRQRSAPR
jgi:hypothetical protein